SSPPARPTRCVPVAAVHRNTCSPPLPLSASPTTTAPPAEPASAALPTPPGMMPRSCIPDPAVQRNACWLLLASHESPTMTRPLAETFAASAQRGQPFQVRAGRATFLTGARARAERFLATTAGNDDEGCCEKQDLAGHGAS